MLREMQLLPSTRLANIIKAIMLRTEIMVKREVVVQFIEGVALAASSCAELQIIL